MNAFLKAASLGAAALAIPLTVASVARTDAQPALGLAQKDSKKPHRVVIQVSDNDPKLMNLALNNAENLRRFYEDTGGGVEIEIVAYGPGLNMLRSDSSPVKERLAALGGHMKGLTISGCGNTMETQSRQENKQISLVPEARVVATGIARIVELQEQGWAYIRP